MSLMWRWARALDGVLEGRFRRDLARRSQRRHRHELAEPLWRVRRQARTLQEDLWRAIATAPARVMGEVFAADLPLRVRCWSASMRIALDMYLSGEDGPRGCFTVMTATSEAVFDPDIRAMVVQRPRRDWIFVSLPPVQVSRRSAANCGSAWIRRCWRNWRRRRSTPSTIRASCPGSPRVGKLRSHRPTGAIDVMLRG